MIYLLISGFLYMLEELTLITAATEKQQSESEWIKEL